MMTNKQADQIKRNIELGKIKEMKELPREIRSAVDVRGWDTESEYFVTRSQHRLEVLNYRRLVQRIGLLNEKNGLTRMAHKLGFNDRN